MFKISHLANSFISIEGDNSILTCDPWIGKTNDNAWYSYPLSNFNDLEKMGNEWIDPWEKPLHKIYETTPCLSPVPSLAVHCANINSVFGLSPFINLKDLWNNNKI